ncbi:MAG TPA: dTDP-4-dehydrorhamnose reductase [Nitrolancea sp.]|nr:dTDP-4-dehydrorhamnose reductase [Nitrolancea sp.]
MRVLISGGTGQLGSALVRTASAVECYAPDRQQLNVTEFDALWSEVKRFAPDLVIHAAAMTDVDGCERDPQSAWRINALATQHIAAAANEVGARLVYISTNFVFDGEGDDPFHEFAPTAPISVYGATKLAGEVAARSLCPRHYVVRTAMVYDETGKNFVNTMLRLATTHPSLTVVDDQTGNPTYAGDLAEAIWQLVDQPSYGTFHLTNQGIASWYEWAVEVFRLAEINIEVTPIQASSYQRAARPPRNGALANLAGAARGIVLPTWQDALSRCLAARTGARSGS